MKKKLSKKEGVTLIELLIVISLLGLIFTLGIYPMLSQIRLIREERGEITLFDEANLSVFYITKDAMMAERAVGQAPPNNNEITFTINAVSLGIGSDPTVRTLHTVRYYVPASPSNNELRREHRNQNGTLQSDRLITSRLDTATAPTFTINPGNPTPAQRHRLRAILNYEDQGIATQRDFDVMLRCRDARL